MYNLKIDENNFLFDGTKEIMKSEIISTIIEENLDSFDDDTPLLEISNSIRDKFKKMWNKEVKKANKLKDIRNIIEKYDLKDDKDKRIKGQSKAILLERLKYNVF